METLCSVCVLQLKEIYRNNSWREIQTVETSLSYVKILRFSWLSYTLEDGPQDYKQVEIPDQT